MHEILVLYYIKRTFDEDLLVELLLYYLVYSTSHSAFYQHAHFITIVGVGKERRTLIGPLQNGGTRYWNYLEDYWPCAGGLSAVNAIGT